MKEKTRSFSVQREINAKIVIERKQELQEIKDFENGVRVATRAERAD